MRLTKLIHLELLDEGKHFYFGSLNALCDMFGKEKIGITYPSLRAAKWENETFKNSHCIIRKGTLITTTRKTDNSEKKEQYMERIVNGETYSQLLNDLNKEDKQKKGNRHRIKKGEIIAKSRKDTE